MRNINHRCLESRIKQAETRKRLFAEGKLTPWNKGKKDGLSKETIKKMSDAHRGHKNTVSRNQKISKNHARYWKGKKRSEETKQKISQVKKGTLPWCTGKKLSKEHRKKMSEGHRGQVPWCSGKTMPRGEKNSNWKGGLKLSQQRSRSRRRMLEHIPLNEYIIGFVAHHLDNKHILYIPEELHKSRWHALKNPESMNKINEKVIEWYINYYSLI